MTGRVRSPVKPGMTAKEPEMTDDRSGEIPGQAGDDGKRTGDNGWMESSIAPLRS